MPIAEVVQRQRSRRRNRGNPMPRPGLTSRSCGARRARPAHPRPSWPRTAGSPTRRSQHGSGSPSRPAWPACARCGSAAIVARHPRRRRPGRARLPDPGRDQGAPRQPQPRPRREASTRSWPRSRAWCGSCTSAARTTTSSRSPSPRRQQLRDLVLEHINVHPIVRHTETQLVFEEMVGAGVAVTQRAPCNSLHRSGTIPPWPSNTRSSSR